MPQLPICKLPNKFYVRVQGYPSHDSYPSLKSRAIFECFSLLQVTAPSVQSAGRTVAGVTSGKLPYAFSNSASSFGRLPIGPIVVPFWDCLIGFLNIMNLKKELLWGLYG